MWPVSRPAGGGHSCGRPRETTATATTANATATAGFDTANITANGATAKAAV